MAQAHVAAIPTAYAGVTFRSRLEARWAAFFTALGWRWSYEPFDSHGWIPDFALSSTYGMGRPVLVEVKPIDAFDRATAEKIDAADLDHEVLLTGYVLPLWNGRLTAGWLRDANMDWSPAPLGRWTNGRDLDGHGDVVGFCHGTGDWGDRITGRDDGPCYGSGVLGAFAIEQKWLAAGNAVQWRPDTADALLGDVLPPDLDPDAEVAAFVGRHRGWTHRRDDEVDALVDQETDDPARKELIGALLSTDQITFRQARRQVARRPAIAGA